MKHRSEGSLIGALLGLFVVASSQAGTIGRFYNGEKIWAPLGAGFDDDVVNALAWSDGTLYAGGYFSESLATNASAAGFSPSRPLFATSLYQMAHVVFAAHCQRAFRSVATCSWRSCSARCFWSTPNTKPGKLLWSWKKRASMGVLWILSVRL